MHKARVRTAHSTNCRDKVLNACFESLWMCRGNLLEYLRKSSSYRVKHFIWFILRNIYLGSAVIGTLLVLPFLIARHSHSWYQRMVYGLSEQLPVRCMCIVNLSCEQFQKLHIKRCKCAVCVLFSFIQTHQMQQRQSCTSPIYKYTRATISLLVFCGCFECVHRTSHTINVCTEIFQPKTVLRAECTKPTAASHFSRFIVCCM